MRFEDGKLFKVEKIKGSFQLIDIENNIVGTLDISSRVRKSAFKNGNALRVFPTGKTEEVDIEIYNSLVKPLNTTRGKVVTETNDDHASVVRFIQKSAPDLKPETLFISDLKWKFLIRSAVRSKNIMMLGPSGSGKTFAVRELAKALDRQMISINLGATQDPRSTLIGNTQFGKDKGTFFAQSAFIKAIQTPNMVILLDEITRAHPDAWNILMTVLDEGQRYVRIDEDENAPTIKVADGVTFIATGNVGTEYTSTRVMDRAILDRFTTIEMDLLSHNDEVKLLSMLYPNVDEKLIEQVAEIATYTRMTSMDEDGELSDHISTRVTVEVVGLLYDGFTLEEAAEIAILPYFSPDGGDDSERTHIKQYLQKFDDVNLGNDISDLGGKSNTSTFDENTIPIF